MRHTFGKASVAWVTLGMTAYYIAHVYLLLRRAVLHRLFLATFLGLAAGSLAFLFLHLTFETAACCHCFLPEFRGGAVSLFWTLFAFGLVVAGIRWQARTLRYLGLGLFSVVVAKVFLVDLGHLASIYRIAAFVALGIVLLLAAFAYLRPARRDDPNDASSGDQP